MSTTVLYLLSAFIGGVASAIWTRLVLARRARLRPGDLVRSCHYPGEWRVVSIAPERQVVGLVHPDLDLTRPGHTAPFYVGFTAITSQRRPRP